MTTRSFNTQTVTNKNITGITDTQDYILFSDARLHPACTFIRLFLLIYVNMRKSSYTLHELMSLTIITDI